MTARSLLYIGIAGLLVVSSCDLISGKKKEKPPQDNVVRTYNKQKQLISEVPMKDKKRHGLAKTYFSNGKVSLELPYVEDKREGISRRYYETGLLFQETDYKNDQMHGTQKKYDASGLISEARYEFGEPCIGLMEYTKGVKRTDYPTLIIRTTDLIRENGTYSLELSVTEGAKRVIYYEGKLTATGCLGDNSLQRVPSGSKKNTGVLKIYLLPGQFLMKELNFIAAVTTMKGNTYLTQKKFNLAIDN